MNPVGQAIYSQANSLIQSSCQKSISKERKTDLEHPAKPVFRDSPAEAAAADFLYKDLPSDEIARPQSNHKEKEESESVNANKTTNILDELKEIATEKLNKPTESKYVETRKMDVNYDIKAILAELNLKQFRSDDLLITNLTDDETILKMVIESVEDFFHELNNPLGKFSLVKEGVKIGGGFIVDPTAQMIIHSIKSHFRDLKAWQLSEIHGLIDNKRKTFMEATKEYLCETQKDSVEPDDGNVRWKNKIRIGGGFSIDTKHGVIVFNINDLINDLIEIQKESAENSQGSSSRNSAAAKMKDFLNEIGKIPTELKLAEKPKLSDKAAKLLSAYRDTIESEIAAKQFASEADSTHNETTSFNREETATTTRVQYNDKANAKKLLADVTKNSKEMEKAYLDIDAARIQSLLF